MEWKFPESDDHIPLQINGIERKIFYDPVDTDTLPFFLFPLQKNRERPFQMDFPEGNRTNQLGGYIFHLVQKGFSAADAFQVVTLMNRYIFDQAIPDDLLQSQILNDSTLQKAESLQKETKNQEISPESFSRFLIEKGYSIQYNELLNIVEYDGIPEDLQIKDWMLYTLTDWFGLVPIFVCLIFAGVGFVQLVQRKSLLKVDLDIILLGVYYVLVIFGYLLFEMVPINYRPVLIEGFLEASYPSSTTLLVLSVMPTLYFQAQRRLIKKALRQIICIFSVLFSVFMVIGRLVSGVHWLTDIVGAVLLSSGIFLIYKASVNLLCKE